MFSASAMNSLRVGRAYALDAFSYVSVLVSISLGLAITQIPPEAVAAAREDRFLHLLRTYPERPPTETFRQVAQLIDEGPFPERDRAEYWIGSARLAAGD